MARPDAFAILGSITGLRKIEEAEVEVPRKPGLYSIYIDSADALPLPFDAELRERGSQLLYIGIASKNLHRRLILQDLRHKSPSTFFRGIGAILGYRPPDGSLRDRVNKNNFKFSPGDTAAIIRWVDDHLLVHWVECERASLREIERDLIRQLTPLMNRVHNPIKSAALARLRKQCWEIACT